MGLIQSLVANCHTLVCIYPPTALYQLVFTLVRLGCLVILPAYQEYPPLAVGDTMTRLPCMHCISMPNTTVAVSSPRRCP